MVSEDITGATYDEMTNSLTNIDPSMEKILTDNSFIIKNDEVLASKKVSTAILHVGIVLKDSQKQKTLWKELCLLMSLIEDLIFFKD